MGKSYSVELVFLLNDNGELGDIVRIEGLASPRGRTIDFMKLRANNIYTNDGTYRFEKTTGLETLNQFRITYQFEPRDKEENPERES